MSEFRHRPKLSVITRTQNRPLLLRRAAYALLMQTFRDFEWIVVVDGGDPQPVFLIAQILERSGISVKVLVNSSASGMEAASNQGLAAANGKYFMIHDDDDSLPSNFFMESIGHLESHDAVVATVSDQKWIVEKLEGDKITRIRSEVFPLAAITMKRLCQENMWPPISMIARKNVLDKIGTFDENLPVLGDWDFHLRLLTVGPISHLSGVYARYHHRQDTSGPYSNTVVAQKQLHLDTRQKVISKYKQSDKFPEIREHI